MNVPAIKFCGLARAQDVETAESLGAEYVGVVFAGGPRRQSVESAAALFGRIMTSRRVGVIGTVDEAGVAAALTGVPLDVIQLHLDPTPDTVATVRRVGAATVWGVLRVAGRELPENVEALFRAADAIVLDTKACGALGGTATTFDWHAVAALIAPYRALAPVVVAGGLTPANVAEAVRALQPQVVDVSSGVESAPGVKDPTLMRRFADQARAA